MTTKLKDNTIYFNLHLALLPFWRKCFHTLLWDLFTFLPKTALAKVIDKQCVKTNNLTNQPGPTGPKYSQQLTNHIPGLYVDSCLHITYYIYPRASPKCMQHIEPGYTFFFFFSNVI